MIKFEETQVMGWKGALRGMRNPKNSWDKADSRVWYEQDGEHVEIGANDMGLIQALVKGGPEHRKLLRMINVQVDITAPLYWWKEFDTYKVGTVGNSCSTMHKITSKEFTLDDFSHEHLISGGIDLLREIIEGLNEGREAYTRYDELKSEGLLNEEITDKKDIWWNLIQLLPSSYNQKRTIQMNYEVLNRICKKGSRLDHKLDEWSIGFMEWARSLPYAEELIF